VLLHGVPHALDLQRQHQRHADVANVTALGRRVQLPLDVPPR
jgi:hypothetical protein